MITITLPDEAVNKLEFLSDATGISVSTLASAIVTVKAQEMQNKAQAAKTASGAQS